MLINSIQANLYPKTCQIKQFEATARNYNTNPLACDTFTPSVSFKAKIHDYAKRGDLEDLKRELAKGIDVNSQDNNKNTALIWASYNGHTEIAIELLKQPNIDVNIQNQYRNTALILASDLGQIEIVKELLKYPDIDVNIQGEYSRTALIWASYHDNIEIVKELLKHPDIDMNIKDSNGKAALDYANREIKKIIEEYVPGVDRREDVIGGVSVKKPQVDINKLSPEDNIWTKEEISAKFLKLIKDKKYDDAAKMLETTPLIDLEGNNRNILDEVCKAGDSIFAEKVFEYKLLKQKQMKKEYDSRRKEFLENTIKNLSYDQLKNNNIALNTVEGFRMLMDNPEFNPNDTVEDSSLFERACKLDPDGNLAKEILAKYGDVITAKAAKTRNKIIKDLIENYEEVGKYRIVLNKIEDNAFYADERRGVAADQLKKLLESPEFTPEIADEVGNSVLHIAAALPDDMGRTLIQMALNKGVDINAENCTGQRPLMAAIKKLVTTDDNAGKMNLMSNIKFLLDKGADINAQDNNGQTAFHFACMSTVAALLTLLLSKKPNVFLEDKMGNRACVYLKTPEMNNIYDEYINRGKKVINSNL